MRKGYAIEQALLICRDIAPHPAIVRIMQGLEEGEDLEHLLMNVGLPEDFTEFYEFFSMKLTVSEAIENAVGICQGMNKARRTLIAKITYPLILLAFLVMFSLFAVLILFPKVTQLFSSFSIETSVMFQIVFFLLRLVPLVIVLAAVIIGVGLSVLIHAIRHKRYRMIERYMRVPVMKCVLQKYFTLKFALYFNELLKDHLDAYTIIDILNKRMMRSDIKILIYEIWSEMKKGRAFEDVLDSFEYCDPLFAVMYKMYLLSPDDIGDVSSYIDIVYAQAEGVTRRFVSVFTPFVYGFVALFVVTIYIAIILPMMNVMGNV